MNDVRSTLHSVHREAFDFGLGGGEADHRDDDGCTGEKPGVSAGGDVEVKKAVAMSISLDVVMRNLIMIFIVTGLYRDYILIWNSEHTKENNYFCR